MDMARVNRIRVLENGVVGCCSAEEQTGCTEIDRQRAREPACLLREETPTDRTML